MLARVDRAVWLRKGTGGFLAAVLVLFRDYVGGMAARIVGEADSAAVQVHSYRDLY